MKNKKERGRTCSFRKWRKGIFPFFNKIFNYRLLPPIMTMKEPAIITVRPFRRSSSGKEISYFFLNFRNKNERKTICFHLIFNLTSLTECVIPLIRRRQPLFTLTLEDLLCFAGIYLFLGDSSGV